ncbi:hypothetical protein PROFUN_08424 [Planoprotostelium fungivorum]|uniref:Uncharacterized protein n=1 Tax=Planoprotostelium fungivorum TaxID=1890364 RepID=A0A2P6NJV5_9EUKA|nr:hypothetical protein PROFUN_08424 [Planoprotostelium fungivorum]
MSDMTASVNTTSNGFHVEGYEKITYDFQFVDRVFSPKNEQLAELYKRWKRVLVVIDQNVYQHYRQEMEDYFRHYQIDLTVHSVSVGEQRKTMSTVLEMVDAFVDFGLVRKEPVLVIGGGLVTDVTGFACSMYRRTSNFIRIPTTLIGLIDASVSIKMGCNHGKLKNRLGSYHAPAVTFLDFSFMRTLPEAQIRNGFAELVKISTVGQSRIFDLLDKYGEELIRTRFGQLDASDEVRAAADEISYKGIETMLELETPNLHEIMLDRVIAFGHTWSPTLELAPKIPLRHGHAINIDMAFSATMAHRRGYITVEERDRILNLMSRVGLSLDHELFDIELLWKATVSIMQTRDGLQRCAVPRPIGECFFINDFTREEMDEGLKAHKELVKSFARGGEGLEAYVDAIDIEGGEGEMHPYLKSHAEKKKSEPVVEKNTVVPQQSTCC